MKTIKFLMFLTMFLLFFNFSYVIAYQPLEISPCDVLKTWKRLAVKQYKHQGPQGQVIYQAVITMGNPELDWSDWDLKNDPTQRLTEEKCKVAAVIFSILKLPNGIEAEYTYADEDGVVWTMKWNYYTNESKRITDCDCQSGC